MAFRYSGAACHSRHVGCPAALCDAPPEETDVAAPSTTTVAINHKRFTPALLVRYLVVLYIALRGI
jgi:hypothetical protein